MTLLSAFDNHHTQSSDERTGDETVPDESASTAELLSVLDQMSGSGAPLKTSAPGLERLYNLSLERGAKMQDQLFNLSRFDGRKNEISSNMDYPPLRTFFK